MKNNFQKIKFDLPPRELFKPTGPSDPLAYYYKPLLGKLYKSRLQAGLNLLKPPYGAVLEFGYGSGLLLPILAKISHNLSAVDIDSDPQAVNSILTKLNIKATLIKNDIVKAALAENSLDLIVAFSVFEHIENHEPILKEMKRILKPDGRLLIGMPRVDKKMAKLFTFIGIDKISNYHVASYHDFLKAAQKYFKLLKLSSLPAFLPPSGGLYFNMLLEKEN